MSGLVEPREGSARLWSKSDRAHLWVMSPVGAIMFGFLAFSRADNGQLFIATPGGFATTIVLLISFVFT